MFDPSYSVVMPPTVLILVCLAGALLALLRPRAGIAIMLAGSVCLFLAALPVVSTALLHQVEAEIPTGPDPRAAQAIIVLGGDLHRGAGGVPDSLGPLSLERVAYAARLYRIVRLPVAVSGGPTGGSSSGVAAAMREELEQDFAVPVAWTEQRSRSTFENASFTAQLLRPENITSVFVVTQAWHMPRALWSFERVGLHAIPWPTPRTAIRAAGIGDFLPSATAILQSFYALHEIFGMLYYELRY